MNKKYYKIQVKKLVASCLYSLKTIASLHKPLDNSNSGYANQYLAALLYTN